MVRQRFEEPSRITVALQEPLPRAPGYQDRRQRGHPRDPAAAVRELERPLERAEPLAQGGRAGPAVAAGDHLVEQLLVDLADLDVAEHLVPPAPVRPLHLER